MIKKISSEFKKIRSSEFNRNFFRLFQGTVAGQLLPILAAPIISRLFYPDQIGEFAFYTSIISICIGLVCLNIDRAIVLPGNSREAKRLIEIALKISFRFSVLAFIVLTGLKILHLLNYIKDFPWWWFLLSIHIFILGLFQVGNYTLSRNKMFRELGRSRIYNGVSYSILQIASYKLESLGLVASSLVSRSFSSMNYMLQMKKTGNITTKTLLNLPNKFTKFEKILMKKYKDFLIFGTSITTLNNTSNQLPIILLQSLYSMQSAGIYSWSNRIIQMPTGLITQAVNQVFYQDVAQRISNKKPIYTLVKSTTKKLFIIGIIPYTILFLFAPQIFGFVFGSKWILAGEYTRCLIPWLFISFLNSPITGVISAYGKQKIHFYNEISLIILRFLSLVIGYLVWNDAFMSVLLFGIVGFIYSIYMYFYLLKIVKEMSLYSKIILNTLLLFKKNNKLEVLKELNNNLKIDYITMKDLQFKQIVNVLKDAYENVPFYKYWFDLHKVDIKEINNWDAFEEKIPILTKKDIIAHIDKFEHKTIKKFGIRTTGGSTGTPLKYKFSLKDKIYAEAIYLRGLSFGGYHIGNKIVYFGGGSLISNQKKKWSTKLYEKIFGLYVYSSYGITDDDLKKILNTIQTKHIKFIRGYVSSIFLLADYALKHHINIQLKSAFVPSLLSISM